MREIAAILIAVALIGYLAYDSWERIPLRLWVTATAIGVFLISLMIVEIILTS